MYSAAPAVRLSSWAIKSNGSKQHAPRKVKLFINRPSLGFSEAADFPAAQEFMLSEADLEGNPLQLKYALFFLFTPTGVCDKCLIIWHAADKSERLQGA